MNFISCLLISVLSVCEHLILSPASSGMVAGVLTAVSAGEPGPASLPSTAELVASSPLSPHSGWVCLKERRHFGLNVRRLGVYPALFLDGLHKYHFLSFLQVVINLSNMIIVSPVSPLLCSVYIYSNTGHVAMIASYLNT